MGDRFAEYMASYRHYGLLRFSLLPLYLTFAIALHGGAITVLAKDMLPPALRIAAGIGLPLIGIISSMVFWGLEIRIDQYITHFRKICAEIDPGDRLSGDSFPNGHRTISPLTQVLYGLGLMTFLVELLIVIQAEVS